MSAVRITAAISHILIDALAYIIDALVDILGKHAFIHLFVYKGIFYLYKDMFRIRNQFLVSVKDKL